MAVAGLTVTATAVTGSVNEALDAPRVAAICTFELLVAEVTCTVKLEVVAPDIIVTEAGAEIVTLASLTYPRATVVPEEGAAALSVTVHDAEPGAVSVAGEHDKAVTVGPRVTVEP